MRNAVGVEGQAQQFEKGSTEDPNVSYPHEHNRNRIAGVDFDMLDPAAVLEMIGPPARAAGAHRYISLVNPHSVMLCHRDAGMREAIRQSWLALPDGIGIVLGAKILSYQHGGRLSGPELVLYLCDKGRAMGLRHYFFGGEEGVAETMAANLSRMFPGMFVAGWACPPFRLLTAQEDADAVEHINAAQPDIVWVGLGAPKQEKWMASHVRRVQAAVMIGVGAAFDFHSGRKAWCPALLRRIGLEWAYRLAREPRRLWGRNVDSLLFLRLVAAQAIAAAVGKHPSKDSPFFPVERTDEAGPAFFPAVDSNPPAARE